MGTRGAFGVIIGEEEKIAYNHFDSYPDGKGVEVLAWLRGANLTKVREQAAKARVVQEDSKPTPEDVEALKAYTNLGVSEQSTDDWYCLLRDAQGDLGATLESGYVLDGSDFPLDSLFCEWAYILDLDRDVFEVYKGFQKKLPTKGRWKGRPTKAEDEANHKLHIEQSAKQGREPWRPERSEYKAVELVAGWSLKALPTQKQFLSFFALMNARDTLRYVKEHPQDVANVVNRIVEEQLDQDTLYGKEWAELETEARVLLAKHSSPSAVTILTTR